VAAGDPGRARGRPRAGRAGSGRLLLGLQFPLQPGEDRRALTRPAMTLVRAQLRTRLGRLVARARRRWLHPTSGRRPGDRFL